MLHCSCRGFSNFCDHLVVQRSLAERLLREVVSTGLSNRVIRNRLLVCIIEFGCSKRVFVAGSFSVPFCLRTEMKNLDRRRSSSLAGMFSIALNSFSDSQNFFHEFKSLLVLYWVFFIFLLLHKFLNFDFIFARSFLGRTQICQRLLVFLTCFLVKVHWFLHLVLLTGTRQFFIFFVCNVLRTTVTTRSV